MDIVAKIFKKLKKQTGMLIGALCFSIAIVLFQLNYLKSLDNLIIDSWIQLKRPEKADSRIVIIGIDNYTLAKYKRYPLDRSQYTQLFKFLQKSHPKVIGFNIILTELLSDPENAEKDNALAKIMQDMSNIIVPVYYDYSTNKIIVKPSEKFLNVSKAVGDTSTFKDPDGVARRIEVQVFEEKADKIDKYWSFGIQIVKEYLGLSIEDLKIKNGVLHIGSDHQASLENNKLLSLNFLGTSTSFQIYPFHQVLSGKIAPEKFKDKIVLIGSRTKGLSDLATVPISNHPMFGVEIHSTLVDNILRNRALHHFPQPILLLITLSAGLLLGTYLNKNTFSTLIQVLLVFVVIISSFFISYLSFVYYSTIFQISPLILGSILTLLSILSYANTLTNIYINREINNLKGLYQKRIYLAQEQKLQQSLNTMTYLCNAQYVRLWQMSADKIHLQSGSEKISQITYPSQSLNSKNLLMLLNQGAKSISHKDLPPDFQKFITDETILTQFIVLNTDVNNNETFLLEVGSIENKELPLPLINKVGMTLLKNLKYSLNTSSLIPDSKTRVREAEKKIEILSALTSQIELDREAFSAVLSASHNAMFLCDSFAEIQYYNPKFLELLQEDVNSNLEGQSVFDAISDDFDIPQETWLESWTKAFTYRQVSRISLNNENSYYSFSLTPVLDKNSIVEGILGVITDITDLYKQANYDGLTSLRNRQNFNEIINQEFLRSRRNTSNFFTLILVDIDHFKSFNDTYGHQVGDKVLRIVARALSSSVRKTDFVARYGGEEMALILPMTDLKGASIVAEKLRQKVEGLSVTDLEGNDISSITISLGLAIYESDDIDCENIIKRADDALYSSKENGRNQAYVHQNKQLIPSNKLLSS